ncbi:hypothetical protein [Streptomyces pseudovenezuelae]|uniref:hypothetical protein n=1 Tax=Streptomyces pseudovenezuelae TaxID=67350 RepID=UPI002E803898|nr:hypothetical protein [Streptomyces pseudovenezuelae]WUA94464.1 hypothetical protein OHO81_44620 [Streptomyces pseudovenezuelae]
MNAAQRRTVQARLKNQAEHYNAAQAKAAEQGPMHLITFWTNVNRKLAKDALESGDRTIADRLAAHLNDFYRAHTQ